MSRPAPAPRRATPLIDYPSQRVLAVIDEPGRAPAIRDAVLAAGLTGAAVLEGSAAADAFDATGGRHGLGARLIRAVQFLLVDQMPDLAWYEAALRDGRAVIAVPARDREAGARAAEVLTRNGAHFVIRFGRFETELMAPWRGPEPRIRDLFQH